VLAGPCPEPEPSSGQAHWPCGNSENFSPLVVPAHFVSNSPDRRGRSILTECSTYTEINDDARGLSSNTSLRWILQLPTRTESQGDKEQKGRRFSDFSASRRAIPLCRPLLSVGGFRRGSRTRFPLLSRLPKSASAEEFRENLPPGSREPKSTGILNRRVANPVSGGLPADTSLRPFDWSYSFVVHPYDALCTWRMYFATVPRSALYESICQFCHRAANSLSVKATV
jgi:hypothetical protein